MDELYDLLYLREHGYRELFTLTIVGALSFEVCLIERLDDKISYYMAQLLHLRSLTSL